MTFKKVALSIAASLTLAVPVVLAAPAGADTHEQHVLDQAAVVAVRAYLHAVDGLLLTRPVGVTSFPAFGLEQGESPASEAAKSQAAVGYELAKADRFRAWAASHQDTYTSVSSVLNVETLTVSGSLASLSGKVETTMLWSSSATATDVTPGKQADIAKARSEGRAFAPGETVTSIVSAEHHFRLMQTGKGWKILSDAYLDPFEQGLASDHVTPRSPTRPATNGTSTTAAPDPVRSAKASATPTAESMLYDRGAAAAYADKYWNHYNRTYPNCNPAGGDCANFVSQALWDPDAADFPIQAAWDPGDRSTCAATTEAWRYTPTQHRFFIGNPLGSSYNFASLGAKGSASATRSYNISSMLRGDVIFYDWQSNGEIDHVTIAVAYAGDQSTLIDSHNADRYHTRWDYGTGSTTYYHDKFKDMIKVS
ncbi:amidase domain-containing protein [Nonomuraea typhae]|uniref:amidase domain-containing protein n=1 Tax=Nonomuraea typhae TaxID=2603600 RepID=UPI0012FB0FC8|nr:amidase domain-containing protein [Nonomuraea typhae]